MKREKKENTVYFLGAGASADAGVPVTGQLLSKIIQRSQRKRRSLHRFISDLGFLPRQDGANRPPIVDVISMLDTCIRENRPLDDIYTVEKLRKLRNELTVELAEVIQHSSRKGALKVYLPSGADDQPGAKNRTIPAYYRRFALKLNYRNRRPSAPQYRANQRLPPADTIITSNYDTNIDLALYEIVYAEDTGYQRGEGRITDIYLGTEFRDPYTDEDAFSEPERAIDLFKLHGSLNWLYCPRCHRIYVAAFGYSVSFLYDTIGKKA